jgi:hypothetical protein
LKPYLRNDHTHDFAIGLSQCCGNGLRIDVHGRANVRVAQEFLLNLEIDSERVEECRVAVAECMPANPAQSRLRCGGYPLGSVKL